MRPSPARCRYAVKMPIRELGLWLVLAVVVFTHSACRFNVQRAPTIEDNEEERIMSEQPQGVQPMARANDETFELMEGQPYTTRGGLQFVIKLTHTMWVKEAPDAAMYEVGVYRLEIARSGEIVVADTYESQKGFYGEGVAFGQLYRVSPSNLGLKVTVYATPPSEPLTEDEAVELAKKTVKARGLNIDHPLSIDSFKFYSVKSGALHIRFVDSRGVFGRVVVGLYTRKVLALESGGK